MNLALRIAGFLLSALGLAVVLLAFFSPEKLVEGVNIDTGTVLLVGGVVALGISVAISAVDNLRLFLAGEDPLATASPPPGALSAGAPQRMQSRHPEVPKRPDRNQSALRPLNGDTPRFTDDLSRSGQALVRAELDRVAEEVRDAAAEMENSQDIVSEEELYVVDERTISGKQARILSDGTVEAETDEGWMRFENIEHLEEYMDAVRRQRGI